MWVGRPAVRLVLDTNVVEQAMRIMLGRGGDSGAG